jgi:hypothetical protein
MVRTYRPPPRYAARPLRDRADMTVHGIASHPLATPMRWFPHEAVCLGCGHGSSLHAADRSGTCLVCAQVRALHLRRRALCRGFVGDA